MLASNIAFWSKYPDMNLTQIVVAVALHTLQIPPPPSSRKGQEQGLAVELATNFRELGRYKGPLMIESSY